jgi:bile acid-coenzyme A ligase
MAEQTQTPLGTAVDQLAAEDPGRPILTCGDEMWTRDDLARRSNRLARVLYAHGAGPGSMVTIARPNGLGFFEAVVAAWKVGAIPQPVSARLPRAERAALIEVADPAVVIGGDDPGNDRPWLPPDYEPPADVADDPLPPVVPPSWKAPASGGSTGRPKLIVATTPGVVEQVAPRRGPDDADEVLLCTGPLYHNGPFMFSAHTLLRGGHVVIMERFDAVHSLELVERHRVTFLYLVPTMMTRILRMPEEERLARDVSSLRTAFHLAAPCPPHVKRAFIEWLGPEVVRELYAGTEAQAITIISGTEWLAHPGSVGRVVAGEMRICDEDGNEVPPGTVGEVWMRPPAGRRTYEYVGARARERDGWESLGDMGRFDEDGYLYLADRQSDMILVGGANVYPAEVEAALDEHPAVLSSCVIGLPDDDTGNVVHAIVETAREVTDDELSVHLADRLVTYKRPRTFERATEPLRDDAGKIRRSALREERIAGRAAWQPSSG